MTQLKVDGTLIAGPPTVTDGTFPAASATAPLRLSSSPKTYGAATGILRRTVAFAVYTDLGEPGNSVTKADFLYFKSNGAVSLRLTTDDGAGGDVVSVLPVSGLIMLEFDPSKFLKLLELLGNATVEYFLSGPS